MSIRKITSATSSLVVSASTTRAGIFKATAQTQSGIKRIQNLSSILIPKIAGAVPSIVDHLAYDPEGIGIRKYIEYLLASDNSELYITLNKSETVVASDYAFATLGFIRTFYDNVVPKEFFDTLLISNRFGTDAITIRDTDYFLLKKSFRDTTTTRDTDRLWINLGKRDQIGLTDTDRFLVTKGLQDSISEPDAERIWFNKVRADVVAGTEDLVTYVSQFKSDTITANERKFLKLSKPFLEILVASDTDRLYTIKRFFDPVASTDSRVTFFINKRLNDTQPTIDLVGVYDGLNYNYSLARFETIVNTDYFSRIFNAIRGPRDGFDDTTTISDRDYLWLNKAARDSVLSLDVRTLYASLRKFDSVSETDKVTKQVTKRAFDSISESDDQSFWVNKTNIDTVILSELFQSALGRSFVDSFSLTDTDRITFLKRLGDTEAVVSIVDINDGNRGHHFIKDRALSVFTSDKDVLFFNKALRDSATSLERDFLLLGKQFFEGTTSLDTDQLTVLKIAKQGNNTLRQRGNYLVYSEQFDQPNWQKASTFISSNVTTAPNGSLTADKFIEGFGAAQHYAYQGFNTTIGNRYIASFYVKPAEKSTFAIYFSTSAFGASSAGVGYYTLVGTGTTVVTGTATGGIVQEEDGWYRCWLTQQAVASVAGAPLYFTLGTLNSYTGDGVSGLYIWGAQVEAEQTLGNYVPTTSSAIIISTNTANDTDKVWIGNSVTGIRRSNDILENVSFLIGARESDSVTEFDTDALFVSKVAKQSVYRSKGNIFQYSEDFTQNYWGKIAAYVSSNVITAPDGTLTGSKFVAATTSNGHVIGISSILPAGNTFVASIYVKPAEITKFAIGTNSSFPTPFAAIYDLSSLTVTGGSGYVYPVNNGWYRCVFFGTPGGSRGATFMLVSSDSTYVWTGDGNQGLYIWGAQATNGVIEENYVRTTSTQLLYNYTTPTDTDSVWIGSQISGNRVSDDKLERVSLATLKQIADSTLMLDAYTINDGSTYSIWKNVFDNIIIGEEQRFVFLKSLRDAAIAFDEYAISDGLRYDAYKYAYDNLSQSDTEKFTILKTAKQGVKIARGNIAPYSEEFSSAGWFLGQMSVSSNSAIAPNGTLTADKLIATGTSQNAIQPYTVEANTTYTASIWIKGEGATIGKTAWYWWWYAGTATGSPGSVNSFVVTDTWTRIQATTTVSSAGVMYLRIDGVHSSMGGATGDTVIVWGNQVELNSFPTYYIPTTSLPIIHATSTAYDTDKVWIGNSVTGIRRSSDIFEKVSFWFSKPQVDSLSPLDQLLYAFSRSERASDSVLITDKDYYWFNKSSRDSISQTDTEKFTILKTAKQSVMTTKGNLVASSEDFEAWYNNTNLVISSNVVIAPNGTLTADTTASVGSTRYRITPNINACTLTYSFYVKPSDSSKSILMYSDGGGYPARTYNITPSTGVFSLGGNAITGNITTVGDGWYRCWFAWNHPTNDFVAVHIYPTNADVHAWWGAQVNTGIGPDNYIQTTLSPIVLSSFTTTANSGDRVWIGNSVTGIRRSGDVNETISFTMLKKLYDDQTVDEAIVVQKFTFLIDRPVFDSSTVTDVKSFLITTVDRDTVTVTDKDYLLAGKRFGTELLSTSDNEVLFNNLGKKETAITTDRNSFFIAAEKSDTITQLDREYLFVNKVAKQGVAYKLQGNLLPYSEDFTQWTFQAAGVIVSSNVVIAPDGFLTADKLNETGTLDYHRRGLSLANTSGATRRFSIYAKAAERVHARGWSWAGGDTSQQSFDLVNGTVLGTQNPSMTYIVDGWWRCEFDVPLLNSTAVVFGPHDGVVSGTGTYAGVTNSGIYVWGGQLDATGTGRAGNYTATTNTAIVVRINDEADRDLVWVGTDVGYRRSDDVFETVSFLIGARESDSVTETDTENYWFNKTTKLGIDRFNVEGNILTHSENVASWGSYSSGVVLASDSVTAPDGTLTADVLTFAGAGYRYHAWPVGNHLGQTLTGSVWLWSPDGSKNAVGFRLNDSANGTDQTVTSITLTTIPTRYSVTRTFSTTGTSIDIGIDNRSGIGGNNTSGSVAVWGLQLNSGTVTGPYIRTTNAGIYIVNDTANSTDRVRVGTYQSGNRTTFDGLEKVSFTTLKRIADTSIAFDEYTISDGLKYNAYKKAFDTVSETDIDFFWFNKVLKDSETIEDVAIAELTQRLVLKTTSDTITVTDSDFFLIGKPVRDTVTQSDTDRLWINKNTSVDQTAIPGQTYTYWKQTIGFTSGVSTSLTTTVYVDDQGYYYIGGYRNAGTYTSEAFIAKLSSNGSFIWNNVLDYIPGTKHDVYNFSVKNDAVIIQGLNDSWNTSNVTLYNNSPYIARIDSSTGAYVWGRYLVTSVGVGFYYANIPPANIITTTSNVYSIHTLNYYTGNCFDWGFTKYDLNGNTIANKQFSIASEFTGAYVIDAAIDNSDNVYCVGSIGSAGFPTNTSGMLVKFDSSGTILWQKQLSSPAIILSILRNTDAIYLCALNNTTSTMISTNMWVSKLDNTGSTIIWQNVYSISSALFTVDSRPDVLHYNTLTDQLYVNMGTTPSSISTRKPGVFVLNSSNGSVIWSRQLNTTSNYSRSSLNETNNAILMTYKYNTCITVPASDDGVNIGGVEEWVPITSSITVSSSAFTLSTPTDPLIALTSRATVAATFSSVVTQSIVTGNLTSASVAFGSYSSGINQVIISDSIEKIKQTNKNVTDSIVNSDAGYAFIQDYVEPLYFLEPYVATQYGVWPEPIPLFVTSTSVVNTNLAVPVPSVQEGDLMIAIIHRNTGVTITPAAGWSSLASTVSVGNTLGTLIAAKIATSSEPSSYTFTGSGFGYTSRRTVAVFRNAKLNTYNTSTVISGSTSIANLTSIQPSSNSTVLHVIMNGSTGYNTSVSPGLSTLIAAEGSSSSGYSHRIFSTSVLANVTIGPFSVVTNTTSNADRVVTWSGSIEYSA